MLFSYRNILLGLSLASSVLCGSPEYSDHSVTISDPDSLPEHESSSSSNLHPSPTTDITTWLEDDEDAIVSINAAQHENHPHSDALTAAQAATNSSTGSTTHTPAETLHDTWALDDDLDDEMSLSLSTPQFLASFAQSDKSTASASSQSSTTPRAVPSNGVPNPAKAALNWLTSLSDSTDSAGNSASSTSRAGSMNASPGSSTTTSTKTTDPAKAALEWLTSGLDDTSATPATIKGL